MRTSHEQVQAFLVALDERIAGLRIHGEVFGVPAALRRADNLEAFRQVVGADLEAKAETQAQTFRRLCEVDSDHNFAEWSRARDAFDAAMRRAVVGEMHVDSPGTPQNG